MDCLCPWASPPPTPTTASGCSRSCVVSLPSAPAMVLADAVRPSCMPTRATTMTTCGNGCANAASATVSPAKGSSPRNAPADTGGWSSARCPGWPAADASPPLRTKARALPRLRRNRCHPHRPPAAMSRDTGLQVDALRASVYPAERQHLGEHLPHPLEDCILRIGRAGAPARTYRGPVANCLRQAGESHRSPTRTCGAPATCDRSASSSSTAVRPAAALTGLTSSDRSSEHGDGASHDTRGSSVYVRGRHEGRGRTATPAELGTRKIHVPATTPDPYTRCARGERAARDTEFSRSVESSERSQTMRDHTAACAPRSRYDVIPVS